MTTECTRSRTRLVFRGLDGRDVVGRFDGGEITADAEGVCCAKWSIEPGFWVV